MKHTWNYYRIKWTAFFITIFILAVGLTALYMARPQKPITEQEQAPQQPIDQPQAGHYSNAAFGALIEENLSELNFIEEINFDGKDEGFFSLSGILSNPKRLTVICPELEPFGIFLTVLKNKSVTINGHLGENEDGKGCFIADTVTFSGQTLPAGIATTYIEKYTGLNELLDVPVEQISLSEEGITFREIPTAIQIASCK